MATEWNDRIVGYVEVDPTVLTAHPENWRTHPKRQRETVRASLETLGNIQPVIVSKRTGRILDGHLRVDLAIETGQPSVWVAEVDLNEDEERLALAVIDPTSAMAEADREMLSLLIDNVAAQHPDDVVLIDLMSDLAVAEGIRVENEGGGTGQKDYVPANAVKQYQIVFDDDAQHQRWYAFLKRLRDTYPDVSTISGRIDAHVAAFMEGE